MTDTYSRLLCWTKSILARLLQALTQEYIWFFRQLLKATLLDKIYNSQTAPGFDSRILFLNFLNTQGYSAGQIYNSQTAPGFDSRIFHFFLLC